MKKDIHPKYHDINVVMTDGTSFKTRSTWGKPDATLKLDIDPKSHPAWTGVHRLMDTGGQLAKFKNRFKNHGIPENLGTAATKGGAVNKPEKPKPKRKRPVTIGSCAAAKPPPGEEGARKVRARPA